MYKLKSVEARARVSWFYRGQPQVIPASQIKNYFLVSKIPSALNIICLINPSIEQVITELTDLRMHVIDILCSLPIVLNVKFSYSLNFE